MMGFEGWFPDEVRWGAEHLIRKSGIPGCVVVAVAADHRSSGMAIGLADLRSQREMTLDSVFHLFSGTKLFTATALMLLVESGQASLDADVREFLPDLPLEDAITLRQLASHNSGLRDSLRAFIAIHFSDEARPTTAEALAKYGIRSKRSPGRGAQYRNVNYALLAEVISRVAGEPYERFVHSALLSRWESDATFEVESVSTSRLSTGYVRRFDPMRLAARLLLGARGGRVFLESVGGFVSMRDFDLDTAGIGGLLGAASDFVPLISEFLSADDGILRADSKREMLTIHARGQAGIFSKVGVGIGWKYGEVSGTRFWNHEGGGPGYCTELRIYPDDELGFVVLMNQSQSRRLSRLAHELCELLRHAKGRKG